MKTKDYNSVNWNEIFVEDVGSPTGLRWKISTNHKIKAGDVAGCISTNKKYGWQSFLVQYNKTNWYVHRVLWVMRNGSIDTDLTVDHIDGNALNNSAENLRLVSNAVNQRNQKQHSTNTSGVTGVSFKSEASLTYAVAHWSNLSGKQKSKRFSCKKLGLLESFAAACAYREQMIAELNNTGAGYSDRHGE
jgi:HNH endonuclease/AP2 domain